MLILLLIFFYLKPYNSSTDIEGYEMVKNEIEILSRLTSDERIVTLVGSCRQADRLLAVYAFCQTDLASELIHLRELNDDLFANGRRVIYASEIADGLATLQENRIVHADITARNILIQDGSVKICDFGLAFQLREDMMGDFIMTKQHSFIAWPVMPPEVLDNFCFSLKTDIWSYGLLVFEMFRHGKALPLHPSRSSLLSYIRSDEKKWIGVNLIEPRFV